MRKRMSNSNFGTMTKELSDGIKNLLGKHVKILLKCPVKLESKGDKTENRILVFCPCRFFCLKVPLRIDFHFHYLDIQAIESKKANQFILTANDKSHSFMIPDSDRVDQIDKMIVTLLTTVNETFPGIPIYNIIRRIDVVPFSRLQHLDFSLDDRDLSSSSSIIGGSVPYTKSKSSTSLSTDDCANSSSISLSINHNISSSSADDRSVVPSFNHVSCGGPSPCGGFSTQYAWLCDFCGSPYREEVSWDVDTIYLSHDTRELCLKDFDHLDARDLIPILSALEYNTYFKSLRSSHVKLTPESIERLLNVIRKSLTIEELHLEQIAIKIDFAQKLSAALSQNSNSQIHTLDLSHNMIEDKGVIHLSNPIGKLVRGPVWLNFSHCGLTSKGVSQLAQGLAANRMSPNTLTRLDLSGNSLKDDINNLCNFLAQPNCITFLDLSLTDCNLETVFGALLRGCTTHLAHLNLTKNNFSTKKGKEIPPSFKQFLTSSLALKYLSLSNCKLSLEALKQLLLGLACNESTADLELDISANGLGTQGAQVLESCLQQIKCLASLHLEDNNLDGEMSSVIIAASKNKSLKHLYLGRNLQSTKAKHITTVMEAIVTLLQEDDCVLQTLNLCDSKLKSELFSIINALGSNQSLQNLDISGNQMGDVGARLLAKALQINTKLRCITYDKNSITLQGFSDISYGLESNMSVRYMPFPVHDVQPLMKTSGEKTETVMKKIQDLLYRNSQPKKVSSNGHQAFRLQQGFLLSSAQQTVDKMISQTQEGLKLLRKNELNSPSSDSGYTDVISNAENIIKDSDRAKQLLVSIHDMMEQKGEGKSIESRLLNLADDFQSSVTTLLQNNIDSVLDVTEEKCPNLMGNEIIKREIREGCLEKVDIDSDYIRHCIMDMAGNEIIQKLNEINLAVAAHISDKLVDRCIDSLMKCHKQINDARNKRSSTPDVLKRLSGEMSKDDNYTENGHSPMATPQLHSKRKTLNGRNRIRPKSVVDCVEGVSADDIPDLLPSLPETMGEESDLPPVSPQSQLKHFGKSRPRKPKTRQPTRPSIRTELIEEVSDLQEGLDTFFRPSSATPIVTPDSDECSTSIMISSFASHTADEHSMMSSRTFKVDENNSDKTSPSSFDTCSIRSNLSLDPVPRSKSTDQLEKNKNALYPSSVTPTGAGDSGGEGQKSPVQKLGVSMGSSVLAEFKARQEKRSSGLFNSSPSKSTAGGAGGDETITITQSSSGSTTITTSVSVSEAKEKFGGQKSLSVVRRPPIAGPKPTRPWSAVDNRKSGEFSQGSSPANTPDDLDDDIRPPPKTFGGGKSSPLDSSISSTSPSNNNAFSSLLGNLHSSSLVSNINSSSTGNNSTSNGTSPSTGHTGSTGPMSMNLSSTHRTTNGLFSRGVNSINSNNNGSGTEIVDISSSPISLPPWGSGEKRGSVRQLAASLSKHQIQQVQVSPSQGSPPDKKSDFVPRNVDNSPASSTLSEHQAAPDFNRARVSIHEWSKQVSTDVWKYPSMRKFSDPKPAVRKWDPSEPVPKSSNGLFHHDIGGGVSRLRKISNEEDVVNV